MKRCITNITCLLLLVLAGGQAKAEEISARPTIPEVVVTPDSSGNASFAGPDLQYPGQAGEPAIPSKIVHLLLPSDADMTTVHVSGRHIKTEPVPGQWQVEPLPPTTVWDEQKAISEWPPGRRIVDGKDMDIYESDAKFPDNLIGRTNSGRIRHWKLIAVPVALFQYQPAGGLLDRLLEIELVVSYTRRSSAAPQSLRYFSNDAETIKRVKALTVNFADMAPGDGAYNIRPSALPEPAPAYVIITTAKIAAKSSELANFKLHKEQRGFNVQVVTENEWGGGVGDAAAENIRGWLQANYQSLNIQYVLLIGNPHPTSGDVPMKMLWPRSNATTYPWHRDSPSDYYYADLTGNWDKDNDEQFGEWEDDFGPNGVDRYWEVRVGRIPYYGQTYGLDRILPKIIRYQQETRESAAWRKRVVLPTKASEELGEAIKDDFIVPKCGWDYHRVYDSDYGLNPPPETIPCTTDNVTDALNAAPTGAVFWFTHGQYNAALDVMDEPHAKTLNNDYPVFTFQASCENSEPESSSNLSYFLLKNGAISTIGATRAAWGHINGTLFPISSSLDGMTYEYAKRLIRDEMDAGTALNDLKEMLTVDNGGWWMNHTVFNIYGDPETALVVPEEEIADNGDPGTSASGNWAACNAYDPFGVDAMCATEPDARYTYQLPMEGLYAVDLWWTGQYDSCRDVSVHIYDGDKHLDTIRIDQSNNSGQWALLDAYPFSGKARVVVASTGGCTTSADAIRFSPRRVIYVDGDRSTSGNGSSWSEAFQSIQEALDAVCEDSEIWIKKGRYELTSWIDIYGKVYLYGGFQGNETARRQRNWKQNVTIIDGQAKTICVRLYGDATINGFTITNGYAPVTYGPPPDGAGILISSGSLKIENVTFSNNIAGSCGGAVYIDSGSNATFLNCVFTDNAAHTGGAIMNMSRATISNCIFSGNSSANGKGAVANSSLNSYAWIYNCIFTNNSGGAINNTDSDLIITNCTIVGNSEYGIVNINAWPKVINCILWSNQTQILNDGNKFAVLSYSNIDQDGYAGTDGNIRKAPQFISLAEDDFRLSATSPCIDTGYNPPARSIAIDFNGNPRIIDGDGDGEKIVDMGALEAFITSTGTTVDIRSLPGTRFTQCRAVDPVTIDEMPHRPDNLIHGLIRTTTRVHAPGATSAFHLRLPEPLPEKYQWFMHTPDLGWIEFSRQAISGGTGDGAEISADRSEATIYITDNGPYDDDPAEGVVADPTGPGTPGVPVLSPDPPAVDFGEVQADESALRTLVITNQGTGDLEIDTVAIAGNHASEFAIAADECSGTTFVYSESGAISIRFSPTSPGVKEAVVSIASNDPEAALISVPLTGESIDNETVDPQEADKKGGGGGSACFIDGLPVRLPKHESVREP